jgi:DNA-binding transcriptional LysR family regulator
VALTPAGEEFYGYATAMIKGAQEAEVAMRCRSSEAVGTVRYTVTGGVAQFAMSRMLPSFMTRYPKIKLVQHVSNDNVDIVADRFDLAIRTHSEPLPDSQLIQRPLVVGAPWHLFAAPEYVNRAGPFTSPQDLEYAALSMMSNSKSGPLLQLTLESDRTSSVPVNVQPRMVAACMLTLKRAAEAGLGIVALPTYVCRDEVRSGRLERILPGWLAAESSITALMPHRLGMTAATRAFIEHIAAAFPRAVGLQDAPEAGILIRSDKFLGGANKAEESAPPYSRARTGETETNGCK